LKGTFGVPGEGAGLAGTLDSMAQSRDIPGNLGRVATLMKASYQPSDISDSIIVLVLFRFLTVSYTWVIRRKDVMFAAVFVSASETSSFILTLPPKLSLASLLWKQMPTT